MLIACWSPKGGSGTTVVSAALSVALTRDLEDAGVLVADLAGDIPAVLGLADAGTLGLTDWLAASPDVGRDAIEHLEIDAGPGLRILPAGTAGSVAVSPERAIALVAALDEDPRPVVVDCGSGSIATAGPGLVMAGQAAVSLMVLRPCYLALRRALAAPVRPSAVILASEEGRSLGRQDVEQVLQVPVGALLPIDAAIARAVDSGLLARRLPRVLEAAIREFLASLPEGVAHMAVSSRRRAPSTRQRPLRSIRLR